MHPRKIILYIATSLDGYIAKPGDNLDFLSIVARKGEDYGYGAFIKTVDTVILGRRTYDWVMGQVDTFPHADKETYVVTRTAKPSRGKTHFYTGDLKELVIDLKKKDGKHIFVDGGAEVVHALMQDDLIDEYIISIIPIFVGDGIRLFKVGRPEVPLKLQSCTEYDSGLVQLRYTR